MVNNVGYCPLIDGSPTEYSTIYTTIETVRSIMDNIGQKDSVITFDLAIYMKAKEIQWRLDDVYSGVVICMGSFHMRLERNMLSRA